MSRAGEGARSVPGGHRHVIGSIALALWISAGCAPGTGARGPTELRFGSATAETGFLIDYVQDIEWGSATLERKYAGRYTLRGAGEDASETRLTARLDSFFVVHTTPHGRGVVDARHLVGSEFGLAIPEGGRPAYSDDAPLLEMPGNLEGRLSVRRFMDHAFPVLPTSAVEEGATWSATWEAPDVEAHIHATATWNGEYRFDGWETVDGADYARIVGRLSGAVTAPPSDVYGSTVEFSGTIEGSFTWLFDSSDGMLFRGDGETTSRGTMTSNGNDTPIGQTTRVRIAR